MIQHLEPIVPVLNLAWWLRWVTETQGPNRGEAVDAIVRVTGLDPSIRAPWCAAFVAAVGYAVLKDRWPLKRVAGCVSLYEDALVKGLVRDDAAPGAIFLQWGEHVQPVARFRHTGFVRELAADAAGIWNTVEGNTNSGGSPEGTGVFARSRTFTQKDRFIHWWEG